MPRKKRPQPPEAEPSPAKDGPPALTVKKLLPPDAVKRMVRFYQDSREIERQWRSIIGR